MRRFRELLPRMKSRHALRLFRLDPGCLDQRPPLLDLCFLVRAKRFRRLLLARRNILAEISEALAHGRVGKRLDNRREGMSQKSCEGEKT